MPYQCTAILSTYKKLKLRDHKFNDVKEGMTDAATTTGIKEITHPIFAVGSGSGSRRNEGVTGISQGTHKLIPQACRVPWVHISLLTMIRP